MKAVIFDIDGTLANVEHRRHHVESKPKNWKAFNAAMGADTPVEVIVDLARVLHAAGYAIVLCTGREAAYRKQTEAWLKAHDIPFDGLYPRRAKDFRPDHIVKRELLAKIRSDGFEPAFVVDDRASVVAMWRAEGLVCLQCAEGDF